ncbi:MAG: ROK family protein [Anaerolineales bacterium]
MNNIIYIGTDCGATTSKVGGVWSDGSTISTKLLQAPTNSTQGPEAVIRSWVDAIQTYLAQNQLTWDQVGGVGLAIPGPFQRYGVLDHSANLPESFTGFDIHTAYSNALAERVGRAVPLTVGNDGNMGGVAEAQHVRGNGRGTVVLLAPGSGLGCAYIDESGLALDGDTLAGMEASHMPAPLHLLGAKAYPCGCGRTWGCIEVYTSLSGLPYLIDEKLKQYPNHELAKSALPPKDRAFALRGLAQKGDKLATELFDFQAKAMGLHVASLAMALDPKFVVIGGGLMD